MNYIFRIPKRIVQMEKEIPKEIPFTPWGKLTNIGGDEWRDEKGNTRFGGSMPDGSYQIRESVRDWGFS